MTWNDMLDNLKQRVRRSIGDDRGGALEPARPSPRLEQFGDRPLATPAADVYENDRELLFLFDVPGGSYEPADWYRAFTLPDHADGSKATSTITNGVLTVRVPKRGTAARLVPIHGD